MVDTHIYLAVKANIHGGKVKIKKENLSLLIEHIILETRAAREWIKSNVDPEDPSEGADLLIAYNDGISKLDVLSWIKKIRKNIPINYQKLGIPLSPGEVTPTDIEYGDSIDILYIVDIVKKFLDPQNQNMMRGAGIHTNLTTSYYPNIMAVKKVTDLIDSTNKRREEEKLRKKEPSRIVKTADNPQGFNTADVDILGKVGPWSVLMPITIGGSISCDISTSRDTTWCTTKRDGENLFHNYVGGGAEVILFYVMDYSRKPDDLSVSRQKSCIANNDSRLSIGFRGGQPIFGQGNGGMSVDAANMGLQEKDVKQALGPYYAQIMKLLKDKSDSLGGKHPAQGLLKKAASDIFFLKDHIKDFKPESKQSFYSELSNYWAKMEDNDEDPGEVFSPAVIDFLFWRNYDFHYNAIHYVFKNGSTKKIKDYVRKVDAAVRSDKWMFPKHFMDPDEVELVDDNFNVIKVGTWDKVSDQKARFLIGLVRTPGVAKSINKNIFNMIHAKVVDYFYKAHKTDEGIIERLGAQTNIIRPKNVDDKTFARYVILDFTKNQYSYSGMSPDQLPDDIVSFMKEYNSIPTQDLIDTVFERAKNNMEKFKSDRGGDLSKVYDYDIVNNVFSNMISLVSSPFVKPEEGGRFLNEQDFNNYKIKENYIKYFEMSKEYDSKEIKSADREFPLEVIFCKAVYDKVIGLNADYLKEDLKLPPGLYQHFYIPVGELVYKLLEMFPSIKNFPLVQSYQIASEFKNGNITGIYKASNAVAGMVASGALSVGAVEKILTEDAPGGYLYQRMTNIDKYKTEKIIMHFFENVKCTTAFKYVAGGYERWLMAKFPEKSIEISSIMAKKVKEMEENDKTNLDFDVEY